VIGFLSAQVQGLKEAGYVVAGDYQRHTTLAKSERHSMLGRLMSLPSPSHLITPPTEYSLVAPGIN
jgi:hypothetical protein